MIGKAGNAVSHIAQAYPDRVEVRGRDLCADLMGRLSFTEYFHLLLTGEEPTAEQRDFLDLLLISLAEHGMMPTNVAARMTLAADPGSLHGAVAAGILGCGPVILGTAEECAKLLQAGGDARVVARRTRAAKRSCPASAIRSTGRWTRAPSGSSSWPTPAASPATTWPSPASCATRRTTWGRPLTMNVSLPIAAVMLDLGFPAATVKAVPILARTAGLLAHLAEEQVEPVGFLMAGAAEEAIRYER